MADGRRESHHKVSINLFCTVLNLEIDVRRSDILVRGAQVPVLGVERVARGGGGRPAAGARRPPAGQRGARRRLHAAAAREGLRQVSLQPLLLIVLTSASIYRRDINTNLPINLI